MWGLPKLAMWSERERPSALLLLLLLPAPFAYAPACYARGTQVRAPILFIAAEHDQLCPVGTVREAAAQAINAKLSVHDKTHFDIYLGETLQVTKRFPEAFLDRLHEGSVIKLSSME